MDLRLDGAALRFQEGLRTFLASHWRGPDADGISPDDPTAFFAAATRQGYLYRHIPKCWGGAGAAPDPLLDDIIDREFDAVGAPTGLRGEGPDMLVPTLLERGTEEQRSEFIAPTLRGEITWCQGYSEPDAGSDLASLRCRAVLEGDEWVVTGQKIWTSSAHHADWMFGLFRTEPEKPRHAGISYLLIPMKQPGIEVRPLKQMTGSDEFNEVFLDGARTHIRYTVGQRGEGWAVSRATLAHERALIGNPRKVQRQFEDLVELARRSHRGGRAAIKDPGIRRRLVEIEGYLLSQRYTRLRLLSAAVSGEEAKVAMPMLMSKLHTNDIGKMIVQLALDLTDAEEGLHTPDPSRAILGAADIPGAWTAKYMFSHGSALGGGAPNIQRNLIGERALGLPRDPRPQPKSGTTGEGS
ncbi:MAG: acyl-CoA dehydrogenase family protein [Deltaproteobacteria bacterium]